MLNIFPEFLIPFLAPTILRLGVGATVFLETGGVLKSYSKKKRGEIISAGLLFVASALLIIGLLTQLAALYLLIDSVVRSLKPEYRRKGRGRAFYIILATAALSLFLSGAGAFALDVPL